jgi:hypothetical protein
MLVDAHAGKNEHMSGKVIALVNISKEAGFPKIIECLFKDEWARTRMDIYSVENGKKDQREFVLAYGPSGSVQYEQSKSYAYMDQNDSSWKPWRWTRNQRKLRSILIRAYPKTSII